MPKRRPRGNSCERGKITQVGLSREVGVGKDFTEGLAGIATGAHSIFRSPSEEAGSTLKVRECQVSCVCAHACAHKLARPHALLWWTVYLPTQSGGKGPEILQQTKSLQSAPRGAKENRPRAYAGPSGFLVPESQPRYCTDNAPSLRRSPLESKAALFPK